MIRIVSLSSIVFAFILVFVGCGSEPVDESEFLEDVRESAPETRASASEAGVIDPGVSSPPSLEMPSPLFDMGLIPSDDFTFKEMPVYNRGGAPLKITSIKTQCPCTTAKMKEDTIPPNGVGTMVIKLDPDKVSGYQSRKTLTIASNDPKQPQVQLVVTATVAGELKLSEREINFGEVEEGKAAEMSIRISQTDPKPIEINGITSRGATEFLTFEMIEVPVAERTTAGLPGYLFIARVSAENVTGRYDTVAKIEIDTGRKLTINIPIKLAIRGDYSFSPLDITVRNVAPGALQEGVTMLTSKVPLEVVGVQSSNPNLKISYAAGTEPNSFRFDLIVPERPDNRLQKDELSVTLKVNGKEVVETIKVVALLAR
jgi:hypothetical protein